MRTFRLARFVRKLAGAPALLLLLVVTANAYTVIMRDGRRLEIPARFEVTTSTLTYEVQPGIQITLQLAAIDVAATEKANQEQPGALLKRAQTPKQTPANAQSKSAPKTITNRDLDALARRRLASEQAYDQRLKELGLPSVAASRKQAEAEAAMAQAQLHERLQNERASEDYWRSRAQNLRTEMAALDAEINYVRMKLEEMPYAGLSGSFTSVSSVVPFVSFGRGGHFRGHQNRVGVYSAPVGIGPQVGTGASRTRGQVIINPLRPGFRQNARQPTIGNRVRVTPGWGVGIGLWPGTTTVVGSSSLYDYSYERSVLVTRFNDLASARAGLNARWRELEDEARRAGVPPGWLRKN